MDGKEILFIKKSRDLILKEGAFPGGAGFRLAEFDPDGTMRRVPKRWEAYYLVDGKHRDLIADMRIPFGGHATALKLARCKLFIGLNFSQPNLVI
jgi:hypothetical protein